MEIAPVKTELVQSGTTGSRTGILLNEEFVRMYDRYYNRVYKYICYRINNHLLGKKALFCMPNLQQIASFLSIVSMVDFILEAN